ncbi:MAG: thiamine phosphate synthase [Pseudomonadota bacterium]
MPFKAETLRLYLVTDRDLCADFGLVETVQSAVAGGATLVQLRDKRANTQEMTEMARALKRALAETGVPLIVNDDVDAAVAADADGVHVGQSDDGVALARQRLGPNAIVGLSCETEAHIEAAEISLLDYLGIGTVFATATKGDHSPPIGLDGLAELCALSPLPTVAIGGLKAEHTHDVLSAGADGLAVVSAICGQPDPKAAAKSFFPPNNQTDGAAT